MCLSSLPLKEGFLLGDVKGEAKNSITDSQMDDVEVIYTIGEFVEWDSHHVYSPAVFQSTLRYFASVTCVCTSSELRRCYFTVFKERKEGLCFVFGA